MLIKVTANHASFRPVHFRDGFNVIYAERSSDSTASDTTNALGKSLLIQIIDFCFGASAPQGAGLMIDALKDWEFTLHFKLHSKDVFASRSVAVPDRVHVKGLDRDWTPKPSIDEETGQDFYSRKEWCDFLGQHYFGLPADPIKHAPSFRSLISYIIRSEDAAYSSPLQYFAAQPAREVQVHVAYLLGLAWENACKWEELAEREKAAAAFNKAVEAGLIPAFRGNVGELEAQRESLNSQVERGRGALRSFKVHPQYDVLEASADRLSEEIHRTTNLIISGKRRLTLYRKAIKEEQAPDNLRVEQLWSEAGVVFGDAVRATLEQARDFHAKLISNRQGFLQGEISRLKRSMTELQAMRASLVDERATVMSTLETHGAMAEFTQLQQGQSKQEQQLELLTLQINDLKRFASERRAIRIERATLAQATQLDFDERQIYLDSVRNLFREVSVALYGPAKPGRMVIGVGDKGMKFAAELEGDASTGVGKMRVFCFDMTVMELHAKDDAWPKFVVHDSVMFDGVDARQRAHAFEWVAMKCGKLGVQYICTLNADMVPTSDFSEGFRFDDFIVHRLRDAGEDGSLFGFRFSTPV